MKMNLKVLLVIAFAAVLFTACKEEETKPVITPEEEVKVEPPKPIDVTETNMSIINKMTATWCGPCGDWGWTLFQEIIDATEKDAAIMGTYGSNTSNYYNAIAGAFKASQAASAGWPAFCANGSNRTEYSSSGGIFTAQTKTNVINEVSRFKSAPVIVGAGYLTEVKNDSIKIRLKTKFFKEGLAGFDYYVGAYVIEDGVIGYQAGAKAGGNSAKHHDVLRASFTPEAFGIKIENGTAVGNSFEKSFQMAIDPTWKKENLKYVVIVWQKLGTKYMFINAHQNK